MRHFLLSAITLIMAMSATSCSNSEEMATASQDVQAGITTRGVSEKSPKLTIYVETNDINPLNMGEYYFCNTEPKDYVVDHVILFASNIRGSVSTVQLYHNQNQTHILNNVNTLVRPLQDKGIKVLLGLLGDHQGVGFANLTDGQIESFAQQVADCVNRYGLDGVDFDDEYAEYGRISGTPSPSGAIFSKLIQNLRAKMPNKLITAFHYGYAKNFNQAALSAVDYMWPDFGVYRNAPYGFPDSKWASMSIHYTNGYPSASVIQAAAMDYEGYGAIMMFNVREYNASGTMNYFAPYVWDNKTVCYTGISWPKNY